MWNNIHTFCYAIYKYKNNWWGWYFLDIDGHGTEIHYVVLLFAKLLKHNVVSKELKLISRYIFESGACF